MASAATSTSKSENVVLEVQVQAQRKRSRKDTSSNKVAHTEAGTSGTFVLKGTRLLYYKEKDDPQSKGEIDLTTGLGVRDKNNCHLGEWPDGAQYYLLLGVATESRTYFLYGTDKKDVAEWKKAIRKVIKKVGKPNGNSSRDPEGKPESFASKAIKGSAKLVAKMTRKAIRQSGLDDKTADILDDAVDVVEDQADASRNATVSDRVKMAGSGVAGKVGKNVDNDVVDMGANVAKEQFEADDDTTVQQRLLMAGGTTLQESSGMVDDQIGSAVMDTAGGVLHDQGEADSDTSVKERVLIAVGRFCFVCPHQYGVCRVIVSEGRIQNDEEEKDIKVEMIREED
eukprot:Em0009g795a